MNWLKKIVCKWVREDWENERQKNGNWTNNVATVLANSRNPVPTPSRSVDCEGGLGFTIWRADGGYVLQTTRWDNNSHTTTSALHIIDDSKDLGNEISKIIVYTNLRS